MAVRVVETPKVDKDFVAVANKYAEQVVAGKLIACKLLRLACMRHLNDLKKYGVWTAPQLPENPEDKAAQRAYKAALKGRPKEQFYFDPDAAAAICKFGEKLPYVKGKWARVKMKRYIVLQPWQCFILCCLFGWLKTRNNLRRFIAAYIEIPRKNGKSVLAAIIGLYMFCMDGEYGAEVYSGATKEKQAWEVFRPAKQMFASPEAEELRELVAGRVRAKKLQLVDDESIFEPIIGKPGDGASPSCAIADEFHEHQTSDQVDTMETGMLAREQPLMLIITTAGVNIAGPCYDKRMDAIKVLEGALEDEHLFCIIFTIDLPEFDGDVGDDWTDPKVLAKANPNFGISVDCDILQAAQRQATLNPIHQNKFKTKHLNIWCSAKLAWMSMPLWNMCGDAQLSLDEFKGEEAWFILDLASKDDIACFGQIFRRMLDHAGVLVPHYYSFAKYYVPSDALTDEDNVNASKYRKWVEQEWLTATEGAEIDFSAIRADVLAYKNKFQCKELIYDPWRATQLAQEVRAEGATTVELRQITQYMSAPMKETCSAVKGARFHHEANPVTNWMVSNIVAKADGKDNIYPRREDDSKRHLKIDGGVSIIMGMNRAMLLPDEGTLEGWLKAKPVVVSAKARTR